MRFALRKMGKNAKAGTLVLLLGLIAAFAGSPYKGSRVAIDATDLAGIVQKEADHVLPAELAGWIVQGRSDYRLIDLRARADYDQYHIPGAESVPLAELPDYGLERNEKVVLYSDGGIHSAQAWFLLKAMQYKSVYMLKGGLEDWKDLVLFPATPPNPSPAQFAEFNKAKELSKFFGGSPRTGSAAETSIGAPSLPKLQLPGATAAPAAAPQKKKKEGC